MFRSDVMWLQHRPGGEYATLKYTDNILAKIGSTDDQEIGHILDFKSTTTWKSAGVEVGVHPVLRPVDKSDQRNQARPRQHQERSPKKAAG